MRTFLGKFLQLSGLATLAGALMAGLVEPTLWNELILMLAGISVFYGGWLIEHKLRGKPGKRAVEPGLEPRGPGGRSTSESPGEGH